MVAANLERIGQPCEKAASVMPDGRLLAVHHLWADINLCAPKKPQQLVAEANAKNRHFGIDKLEKLRTKAGICRMPGAWRNADHFEIRAFGKVKNGRIVIFEHKRILAQGLESLGKIIGKGIVVIDQQEHNHLLPPAGQDA